MNISEWAKREVEIACECEQELSKDREEWGYGIKCYESALKAFNSLMEDNHSGYSIGITKYILNRLIERKVLTPIEDTPDVWEECFVLNNSEDYKHYQCNRMSSLFKYVYNDGAITFKDVNRVVCYYKDDPNCCTGWHSGLVDRIIYVITPTGDKVTINRYFKEGPSDWIEIDNNEFNERMQISKKLNGTMKGEN